MVARSAHFAARGLDVMSVPMMPKASGYGCAVSRGLHFLSQFRKY
jgi:hypothetical protein